MAQKITGIDVANLTMAVSHGNLLTCRDVYTYPVFC